MPLSLTYLISLKHKVTFTKSQSLHWNRMTKNYVFFIFPQTNLQKQQRLGSLFFIKKLTLEHAFHACRKSCNPKQCKINTIVILSRWICAVVESNDIKRKHLKELENFWPQNKKQTQNFLHYAINMVVSIPIEELRSP